jgi:serine protease inhibitor
MNKSFLVLGILALMICAAAAGMILFGFPYSPNQPPLADDINSTYHGVQEVVNANNQFAFDLYSEFDKSARGNMFYSPYSIFSALAMVYEGARGQTASEIEEVFHFPDNKILRSNFAAIYNKINKESKSYDLRTGNALWTQQDYQFFQNYTNRVEQYYGGRVSNLDFKQETERSRQTINSFIEEQTNNKIKDLIPIGALSSETKLVLTNAIYFKGTWEWEFDRSDTNDQEFKVTSNNIVQTRMMHMDSDETKFNYADLDRLQILELPYEGEKISMLILLPKQREDYDFETGETTVFEYALADIEFSAEKLDEYKAQMQDTKLDSISLPKFEFDAKYFMQDILKAMGMPTAFNRNADFSRMNGNRELAIDAVIHQAYVKVDEKGTEAAAATAVVMLAMSAAPRNVFIADHPFIFIIQEKETGSILFMGRVSDPTQQ